MVSRETETDGYELLVSAEDPTAFYASRTTTDKDGRFSDIVGSDTPNVNEHYVITQTSIGSNSAPCLSTTFPHHILVTNGFVIINFAAVQP